MSSRSATGRPCKIVPLAGRLRDDTDTLSSMAKIVAMNISDAEVKGFASAIKGMENRSPRDVV